jgi:hypothetical protein
MKVVSVDIFFFLKGQGYWNFQLILPLPSHVFEPRQPRFGLWKANSQLLFLSIYFYYSPFFYLKLIYAILLAHLFFEEHSQCWHKHLKICIRRGVAIGACGQNTVWYGLSIWHYRGHCAVWILNKTSPILFPYPCHVNVNVRSQLQTLLKSEIGNSTYTTLWTWCLTWLLYVLMISNTRRGREES